VSVSEPVYVIELTDEPAGQPATRDTIGGRPILAAGQDWPRCYCDRRMILFFQVDVPDDVPTFGGDHLLVFQCPEDNDAAIPPTGPRLPDRYWDRPSPPNGKPFWRILVNNRPGRAHPDADPFLRPRRLILRRTTEVLTRYGKGQRDFKLGGVPSWAQDPEHYVCACGADLAFLCQVPEDYGFETLPGQEEQPGWYRRENYALFLGNEVYILACPAHCHPAAAWPVNQN
jgi:hypothetical protein